MNLLSGLLAPHSRILDFGSGSGEFLDLAGRSGHDATGIEPGHDFARYAQATYGARVVVSPWQGVALPNASFDLISAQHVLEHLREPVDALARMASWLAEDGLIHVEVPDAEALRPDPLQQFHFAHIHHFTARTLVNAAAVAGLTLDPRSPSKGTTLMFRKRAATGLGPGPGNGAGPGTAGFVAAQMPPDLRALSPLNYLASGAWASNAMRRIRKGVRDLTPVSSGESKRPVAPGSLPSGSSPRQ